MNKRRIKITVSNFGATLCALRVPDKDNILRDVVLGYDSMDAYDRPGGTFFGATIGRNANRIRSAGFEIDGITYHLEQNDHQNNLHSGSDCYSFRNWEVKKICENGITFSLHSPDGDQGFPSAVDLEVTYTLTDEDEVIITYVGVPHGTTPLNLTNHSYFNLDGHKAGDVLQQELWMDADYYTLIDADLIPTGECVSVEGTPMDFRNKKPIGRDIHQCYDALLLANGYDHNWCLNNNGKFAKVAELTSKSSGIGMEVYTDLPGMQVYTANFVKNEPGKEGAVYQKHQGICFETQYYPDAINQKNFQSPVFKAGEEYRATTVYKFIKR